MLQHVKAKRSYHNTIMSEIFGFHSNVDKDSSLLRHDVSILEELSASIFRTKTINK